ncbi:MAG: DUF1007 family protein [Bauldia sp.]
MLRRRPFSRRVQPLTGALCLATAVLSLAPPPAAAHPHVFPVVKVTALFDGQGRLTAAREKWSFDYDYSAVFKLEADTDKDGSVSEEETARALTENLGWIARADYYTRLTVAGRPVAAGEPSDLKARFFAGKLFVEFTLPLAEPADVRRGAGIDVFDAEFFYDFEWDYPDVEAVNSPADCLVDRRVQANIDPVAAMIIRQLKLPADPAVINDPAVGYAVRAAVSCGADAIAAAAALANAPPSAAKPAPNVDR